MRGPSFRAPVLAVVTCTGMVAAGRLDDPVLAVLAADLYLPALQIQIAAFRFSGRTRLGERFLLASEGGVQVALCALQTGHRPGAASGCTMGGWGFLRAR